MGMGSLRRQDRECKWVLVNIHGNGDFGVQDPAFLPAGLLDVTRFCSTEAANQFFFLFSYFTTLSMARELYHRSYAMSIATSIHVACRASRCANPRNPTC